MRSSDHEHDEFEVELAETLSSVPRPRLSEGFDRALRARLAQQKPALSRRVRQRVPTLPARAGLLVRLYFGIAAFASLVIVASTELPTSLPPIAVASILLALAFSLIPLWMMQKACPRLLELIVRTVQ